MRRCDGMPRRKKAVSATDIKQDIARTIREVYRSGAFGTGGLLAACEEAERPDLYRTILKAERENMPLEATLRKSGPKTVLPTIFEEKVTKWAHARRKGRRCANRLEVVSQIQQYMEYSDIKPPKGSKSVEKTSKWVPGKAFWRR